MTYLILLAQPTPPRSAVTHCWTRGPTSHGWARLFLRGPERPNICVTMYANIVFSLMPHSVHYTHYGGLHRGQPKSKLSSADLAIVITCEN
jgi:hypothetical protein